eukprot:CAMPEP_0196705314 /NCGR_PEP_ID=MMETSP1090-20130531/59649_1 /TAXON_ID=37098 /ORGANISM="Isochrysis sp, Strain CCMP1244" /LENGTH=61 /DNA_ID=CAMNT_0042045217 /DNA_START=20 /DNA_END=202 /DNA_ORIENTATION=-
MCEAAAQSNHSLSLRFRRVEPVVLGEEGGGGAVSGNHPRRRVAQIERRHFAPPRVHDDAGE